MAKNQPKWQKYVKKGNLHVLLNSMLAKLGPKVDQHLLHCQNEDQKAKNQPKWQKYVKKANLHVLLNSTLMKLGQKVDLHLPHCRNEDQKAIR